MQILGISGSLREGSLNSQLLDSASRVLPADAELVPLETELLRALPHYDEDLDGSALDDQNVRRLRELVAGADAILWVTPEYNGGVPSAIKNALDWVSRPKGEGAVQGRPSAVISASTGAYGGVWAQDHLRKSLAIAGARVIDAEFAIAKAHELKEQHGDVLAAENEPALAEILERLTEEARINAALARERSAQKEQAGQTEQAVA
jgi:chromate reductase